MEALRVLNLVWGETGSLTFRGLGSRVVIFPELSRPLGDETGAQMGGETGPLVGRAHHAEQCHRGARSYQVVRTHRSGYLCPQ